MLNIHFHVELVGNQPLCFYTYKIKTTLRTQLLVGTKFQLFLEKVTTILK